MNTNIYGRKNSNSFRGKIEDSNSILKLSGSRILTNSLDNKKYINSPQKTLEIITTINNNRENRLLTLSNEHLPSYKKLPLCIKNKNNIISTDNSRYKSNKNILIKDINTKNSDLNKESKSRLYLRTDNNTLDAEKIHNKREKFIFLHEIKKIKKSVDLSHRDKSIKSIMNSKIAFDEKNSQIALKPIKILNNFQDYKENEVPNKNDTIFSFLTEKAKISRKNVLIKLLKEQKETYNKTIDSRQRMLTEIKKNIDIDENDFQNLVQNQKTSTKKIEELLEELVKRNRSLIIEHYRLRSEIRVKQDERQKILERINEFRLIAKFVTKALGGKAKLFDFKLTTFEDNTNKNEYTYEKETQKILQRFSFFLNFDPNLCYINQDDIDIFNEITSLNYSDLLFHQLWKKEDSILNNLKRNESLKKEIVFFRENEDNKYSYMKKKIVILEKELKYNQGIYLAEKKEYDELYQQKFKKNSDFEEIITDLYNFFFVKKKNSINKINKRNSIVVDVEQCVSYLHDAIVKKEEMVNKLTSDMDKYQEEDKALFDMVLNNIKNFNKQLHVNNMKRIIEMGEQSKLKLFKIPKEKIILKSKKCEPPYYLAKKEKKVKVDPELIKQLENEELLTYE